ncbi:hypothetical protein RhiJN_24746 [Ceratobasidium sp. AG-Ba]|nr:hypothetical protein RhiJN_24746 [Ceratobasidium sp. AG-Ba]
MSSSSSYSAPSRSPTPEPFLDWFRRTDGNQRQWESSIPNPDPLYGWEERMELARFRLRLLTGANCTPLPPPPPIPADLDDRRLEDLEEGRLIGPPSSSSSSNGDPPGGPMHPISGASLVVPGAHDEFQYYAAPPSPGLGPTWFDQAVSASWEDLRDEEFGYQPHEYRYGHHLIASTHRPDPSEMIHIFSDSGSDDSSSLQTPSDDEMVAAQGLVELSKGWGPDRIEEVPENAGWGA